MPPLGNNLAGRWLHVIVGASAIVLVVGCQEQPEIRQYEVPRADTKKEPWRLLGAIIPRENQVWFFRLEGPEKQIDALTGAFDRFLKSIRFSDKAEEPITWTLPEGWRQEAGNKQFRFATIRIGDKEALEMTVIPLPREHGADSVLANVTRWRDQLGLDPIPQAELGQNTEKLEVNGVAVTKVDIKGFRMPKRAPMFAAGPKARTAPAAKGQAPLTYDVPAGWQEGAAGGIRVAAFKVKEGNDEAEVTIIPLAKEAGNVLANVNRWRGEVELPPTTEARLADEVRPITVDGIEGQYVDLAGARLRTLAVMLVRDEHTWFLKMRGPAELVGKQKTAFEGFVRSVKFKADAGN